jgi:hypothetical protein
MNPQKTRPQPQPQPVHQYPEEHDYMYNSARPHRPQQQQQQQKKRNPPQHQYDPFGMTRSGFFGPSNNMFGFF